MSLHLSRHIGVSCEACGRRDFSRKRYKCLVCYNFDLCAYCYKAGETGTGQHSTLHPMQCVDADLFSKQPQTFTCPLCGQLGFSVSQLQVHVKQHSDSTTLQEVICPICATHPSEDPNYLTKNFPAHLKEHGDVPGSSLKTSSLVEIEFSDLEIKEKVGGGGFGTVSKGLWISENKIVAIKTMLLLDEREIRILSSLDHPSIIQYYGTAMQNNVHYIVTEFADNGSIHDYIYKEQKQPCMSQRLLWAVQVAEGMVYLHQQDIIHRDLKSSNVVLTSTLNAKICDLGSARSLQHTTLQTTAVGTYAWMSPEMLRREEVSKSCDVYSYGMLLFEIATLQVPFHDVLPLLVPSMTMDGKRPTIPETCDSHLADLIKCCWHQDPKARPSFKEILITLSIHH